MAKKKMIVEWHAAASNHFNDILEYLYEESDAAASIVGNTILDEIEQMAYHPEAHPLDRFKKNNNGRYRASTIYSYRISYYVDQEVIYILRIRHASREPLEH